MMGRGDWIILRTAGRSTLSLAESLAEDGYEVWTPIETKRIRVARANARRVVKQAMLKGFVFARHPHRFDLLALSNDPRSRIHFSILLDNSDEIAKVGDRELDGLRWVEARLDVTVKKVHATMPQGVSVRVSAGLFSGMIGIVRRSKRGVTLVCFNDRYSAEIPTSLLDIDGAYRTQLACGEPAALAA